MKEDNWEHRSEGMKCKTCIFFVFKNPPTVGRCRINAPTLKGWPVMFPDDWCGEHRLDENKVTLVQDFGSGFTAKSTHKEKTSRPGGALRDKPSK